MYSADARDCDNLQPCLQLLLLAEDGGRRARGTALGTRAPLPWPLARRYLKR
jgi:hypothetical protein